MAKRGCHVRPPNVGLLACILLSASILLACGPVAAGPADGPTHAVELKATPVEQLDGATLTAWRRHPVHGWTPERQDVEAKAPGVWAVDVPAGEWLFEINFTGTDRVVALRTEPTRVTKPTTIAMPVSDVKTPALKLSNQPYRLYRMHLASAALAGQAEWHGPALGDVEPPTVVVSRDQKYWVAAFGDTPDAEPVTGKPPVRRVIALWQQKAGREPWDLKANVGHLNTVRIRWHDGVAATPAPTVTLRYPNWSQAYHGLEPVELTTNRAFVSIAYEYRDAQGRAMRFRPKYYDSANAKQVQLAGPLKAHVWAMPMTHDTGGGNHVDRLVCGVGISDEAGHELHIDDSDVELKAEASIDGGQTWRTGEFEADSRDQAIAMYQRLGVRVTCEPLGLDQVVIKPRPAVRIRSQRFEVDVPDVWQHRGAYYLGKLERMHTILRAVTGRPGPERVSIRWQTNTHSAWALVGGRSTWMLMPYRSLQSDDWYGDAPIVAHEMLHNFGYGHGDEMTRHQDEAGRVFDLYRWHIEVQPGYLPTRTGGR